MNISLLSYTDIDSGIDLANTLDEAGIHVTLYMSRSHVARAVNCLVDPTERVFELGLLPPTVRLRLFEAPRMRDPRSFLFALQLYKSIKRNGADLAHIMVGSGEVWLAVLAGLLRDLPVVSTMREPKPNFKDSPPAVVVVTTNKLLARWSDVIIVNAKNHVPLVQEKYHVSQHRVNYVPLGPRITAVRWSNKTVPEEPATILFFGNVQPRKGLEYLVRCQPTITSQVHNARIIIAGRGKEELTRCRQMMQDTTRFEIHDGFIPNDKVADLFQRASLVALPYVSASTSGILMTAYVFGKPVVVTRVGSLPEFVDEGVTGLLVPPKDTEQLSIAITRLLLDDTLRHRMGENAARWAGEKQKKICKKSLDVYEQTIAVHKSRKK